MQATRALLLAALVAVATVALSPSLAGGLAASDQATAADGIADSELTVDGPGSGAALDEHESNVSTEGTIGYVEGYWYNESLPVDDRDDATLSAAELESVVYRSMARVEVIRGLTFQEDVPVEVRTREEFQAEEELFGNVSEEDRLYENVRLEALFMAGRDADAFEEWETVYGDSVAGYYDPGTEKIVLVSGNGEEPEVDEPVLAHELFHALQDQHFNLTSYERDTQDEDLATDGLIEGAAGRLEDTYADRCGAEWSCTIPAGQQPPPPPEFNWGLYFTLYHPYDDGPAYVEHLYQEGGWDAVNAAYDDPPASTSEVIRPGEEREPRPVDVEDRSSDAWEPYEFDGGVANDTIGEAGLVAMLADGALEDGEPSVIGRNEFVGPDLDFDYDQPYTDGWAGDELVVYVGEDETVEESGYVWRTEWTSEADAQEFLDGYLTLLENHGAEPVDGHQNTFQIESGYPGAYAIDHDGETVTIVRAPSVDELSEIRAGAASEGEDTLTVDNGSNDDDIIPGFGVGTALAALLVSLLAVRARA